MRAGTQRDEWVGGGVLAGIAAPTLLRRCGAGTASAPSACCCGCLLSARRLRPPWSLLAPLVPSFLTTASVHLSPISLLQSPCRTRSDTARTRATSSPATSASTVTSPSPPTSTSTKSEMYVHDHRLSQTNRRRAATRCDTRSGGDSQRGRIDSGAAARSNCGRMLARFRLAHSAAPSLLACAPTLDASWSDARSLRAALDAHRSVVWSILHSARIAHGSLVAASAIFVGLVLVAACLVAIARGYQG